MTNTSKTIPRDGRLLALILASKGIQDADERVIHQLLDFAYRYTGDVLQQAQALADHAARPGPGKIEKEDVELAIQLRRRYEFVEAPPRDYLVNLAHELNSQPLPPLPESFEVVRLPPPAQRLTEVTFDLVPETAALSDDDLRSDSDSESDDDADGDEEEPQGDAEGEEEADGEDEEMEEVVPEAAAAEREVDEDYDA